jgi:hypothetical protein
MKVEEELSLSLLHKVFPDCSQKNESIHQKRSSAFTG